MNTNSVYTIGYSNLKAQEFLRLLNNNNINAIADVRSVPYSQFYYEYNKDKLKEFLRFNNIYYVWLGKELGAKIEDINCYFNGKVQYDLVAKSENFNNGLARVVEGATKHRIALMCAEKDPINCHRSILVSRHLVMKGLNIVHVLHNGCLETHRELEQRLLRLANILQDDLFRGNNESIDIAYRMQEEHIAFSQEDVFVKEDRSQK